MSRGELLRYVKRDGIISILVGTIIGLIFGLFLRHRL